MLSISSHMCRQANSNTFFSSGSVLFFSYLLIVWYVHFRTTKKVAVTKQLISLIKNGIHNGCNIQCEYNNANSKHKKTTLLEFAKVTLTPLTPFIYRRMSQKNIFRNLDINIEKIIDEKN